MASDSSLRAGPDVTGGAPAPEPRDMPEASDLRKGPDLPVRGVCWDDCQKFLKKLNETIPHPVPLPTAGEGAKRTGGFRLPTEAEWEWACRAGTRTRFCFGDDEARLGEYAWYQANAGGRSHPVGRKRPNAWGLYDCHGNVWEWCSDWYRDGYRDGRWPAGFRWVRDPQGPPSGQGRVGSGGSWSFPPEGCCSEMTCVSPPDCGLNDDGFRVALTIEGP